MQTCAPILDMEPDPERSWLRHSPLARMPHAARQRPSVGLVLALAVGLAAGLLLLGRWRAGRLPAPAGGPEAAAHAGDAALAEEPPEDPLRRPVEAPSAEPGPSSGAAAAEREQAGELTGRVVDREGRPVPRAEVVLERTSAPRLAMIDLDLDPAIERVAETSAGAAGEFRFLLRRGVAVTVRASAGELEAVATERYAGEHVELVLAAASLVHGRILRERDGSPVAGARVRVFRIGGPTTLARATESAHDGSYELRFPFAEGAVLEVLPQVERSPGWISLELGPERTLARDVLVPEGILVTGRVTDAESGAPIAGATVGEGWIYRRRATTDAAGEYRLPGFGDPGLSELFARAPGHAEAKLAHPPAPQDGVLRADFALARGHAAHGRVVDPAGAPLAGVRVLAIGSQHSQEGQELDWISGTTGPEGRFRLEGLRPWMRHALVAQAPGWATQVLDFPPAELAQAETDLGDLALTPPALVRGRVEDALGRPLAGTDVVLRGAGHGRGRLGGEESGGIADFFVATRAARTDGAGRFGFGDVAPGEYTLEARQAGMPGLERSVAVEEGVDPAELVVVLGEGSALRGRAVGEGGEPLARVLLSAWLTEPADPAHEGPSRVITASTDGEGRFALEGLVPGAYRITASPFRIPSPDPEAPWLATTLEGVRSGTLDLVIPMERGAVIRGVLRDAAGQPLSGYVVSPGEDVRTSGELFTTGLEGRFALVVPRDARCDLEVRARGDEAGPPLLVERGVAAGTRDLLLRLDR